MDDLARVKTPEQVARIVQAVVDDPLRDHVQLITDALPVLVSYVDAEGRYRFANATYEQWVGVKRLDILGSTVREVLGEAAFERVRGPLEKALAGERVVFEGLVPYPSGSRFIEAMYIPDIRDRQIRGVVVLVTDITVRKHLEREAVRARMHAELMYSLVARVNAASSEPEIYDAALDAIARALDTPRSAVLLYDDKRVMQFVAARGLSETYRIAVTGHSPWQPDDPSPEPLFISDVRTGPGLSRYQALFLAEKIGALGFFPLVTNGKLIGKFMVYYETPRTLSDEDHAMARAIADHVAAGVARFSSARARDRLVAQLERSVHFNEMFAGMLGHDLRNPLGAMITGTQLVQMRMAGDKKTSEALARVVKSGERMTRMIDQLLDVTRARIGGGILVHRSLTDLKALARQVIDELALAHPRGEVELAITGDVRGSWDPDRLAQVFSNLISNALQHGIGPVLVTMSGGSARIRIEVQNDTEIPAALAASLFEPFRGSRQKRDGSAGMGLGLYITQQIVEAHGGTIEVVSQDGRTTFAIDLPRV